MVLSKVSKLRRFEALQDLGPAHCGVSDQCFPLPVMCSSLKYLQFVTVSGTVGNGMCICVMFPSQAVGSSS